MTCRPWEHFKIEGEKIIFTIQEPKNKFDQKLLESGMEFETDEYTSWKIANEHFKRLNSISKELRSLILEKFKEGGISISEVAEFFEVKTDLVADIICFNIKQASYLGDESI